MEGLSSSSGASSSESKPTTPVLPPDGGEEAPAAVAAAAAAAAVILTPKIPFSELPVTRISEDDADAESSMTFVKCSAECKPSPSLEMQARCEQLGKDLVAKFDQFPEQLRKLGLLGVEMLGTKNQVAASLLFNTATLKNGEEVARHFFNASVTQIPSTFLTSSTGWFTFINSPFKRFIALVALTPTLVTYIPHANEHADPWNTFAKQNKAGSIFYNKEASATLDAAVDLLVCTPLDPGEVFITHAGMPLQISGPEDSTIPPLVQTVITEPTDAKKKRSFFWNACLKNGIFDNKKVENVTGFDLYQSSAVQKLGEKYDKPIFEVAQQGDVPWLTIAVEAKSKKRVDGAPSVSEAKGKKTSSSKGFIKPPLAEAYGQHAILETRISKLNPAGWQVKWAKPSSEHRSKIQGNDNKADSRTIKQYKDTLATLERHVTEAEKVQDDVPIIMDLLGKIETMLKNLEFAESDKAGRRGQKAREGDLEKLRNGPHLMHNREEVEKLYKQVLDLDMAVKAKREEVVNVSRPTGRKRTAATAALDIEPVDEDALEEHLLTGKDVFDYWKLCKTEMSKFQTLTQAINTNAMQSLFDGFKEGIEDIATRVKETLQAGTDPDELVVDCKKLRAYNDALTRIHNAQSELPDAVGSDSKKQASVKTKRECKSCGKVKIDYQKGHCYDCYLSVVEEDLIMLKDWHAKFSEEAENDENIKREFQKFKSAYDHIKQLRKEFNSKHIKLETLLREMDMCKQIFLDTFKEYNDDVEDSSEASYSDEEEEEEEEEEDESDLEDLVDDKIKYSSGEEDEDEYSSSSSSSSDRKKKKSKKRARSSNDKEESGPSLADRMLRAELRFGADLVREIKELYLKGEKDRANYKLKDLEAVKQLYVVEGVVFISEQQAKDRAELLEAKNPGKTFTVEIKNVSA
jgi:hypothetical protein